MKQTSVSELKASLSGYLALVKKGSRIIVTERNTPIAQILPLAHGSGDLQERKELLRKGIIEMGNGRIPKEIFEPSPIKDPSGSIRKAIQEEREESW